MTEQPSQVLAWGVDQFAEAHSIGRTVVYQEIAAGRLLAAKVGRRRVITAEAAAEWRALLDREARERRSA